LPKSVKYLVIGPSKCLNKYGSPKAPCSLSILRPLDFLFTLKAFFLSTS